MGSAEYHLSILWRLRLLLFMGASFKHEFTYTHLLFIIFLVIANDKGVTNPLGSTLTKFGLLLWFKSYCIPFFENIPLSYISELFMSLDTLPATLWKEDFDTI